MLCYVMLCYVMLCYVMLCYVMLCYVMLCYVMLRYVMLCYVMLCYAMFITNLFQGYSITCITCSLPEMCVKFSLTFAPTSTTLETLFVCLTICLLLGCWYSGTLQKTSQDNAHYIMQVSGIKLTLLAASEENAIIRSRRNIGPIFKVF